MDSTFLTGILRNVVFPGWLQAEVRNITGLSIIKSETTN